MIDAPHHTDQQTSEPSGGRPAVELQRMIMAPLQAVRTALPDSPVPVVLGAGALALGGVIDWPAVGAVVLGYLALRRWHTSRP